MDDDRHDHDDATAALLAAVSVIAVRPAAAARYARVFLDEDAPVAPATMSAAVRAWLDRRLSTALRHGWLPSDLGEVTRRRTSPAHVPVLAGLLHELAARYPCDQVADAWRDDLAGLGRTRAVVTDAVAGLEVALRLCALVAFLPVIPTLVPPPGSPGSATGATAGMDAKVLARVRALLAKAESTEFPEEAEALSGKAQELISRYALDRMTVAAAGGSGGRAGEPAIVSARMWIDAPYVMAKALLVGAVASANRCRSVVSESVGFATVVGTADDVEAVELLATSLLVQASAAMARHGAHVDRRGTSRTRSFRQSFLLSYATRIGERLRAATEAATEQSGHAGELVPLLRHRAERVDAALDDLFPHLVSRPASVSNPAGWAAGRAAADLATLDARGEVTSEAG